MRRSPQSFSSSRDVAQDARRRALVALNSCPTLPREAICRLGQELDLWAGDGGGAAASRLQVPRRYLREARPLLARADELAAAELGRAAALGARVVTLLDPDYPPPLLELALPPPVLYCLGEPPPGPAAAIVGSRAADAYGREAATLFARELAAAGLTVVSGMARGIDTAAHRGALEDPAGLTVGVLGCGLEVDYPPRSGRLRRRIAGRGAVITEFPCGATPHARNFPIRNRIIAALAVGTLVVQGAARSGSLITARLALELGRDVWAVPGRIFDSRSAGPNTLIRDGALPAQHPRDVLESLPIAVRERLPERPGDRPGGGGAAPGAAGRLLAEMVPGEPLAPAALAAATELGVDRVLALLLELELAGRVRREPGPAWCRRA